MMGGKLGSKRRMRDVDFAVSFFRRNGARKELLRHLKKEGMLEEDIAVWTQALARDLMQIRRDDRIRLLDVGSCYNPLRISSNAGAFDATAIDLQPAHFSVLKGDFLRVGIVDKRGGGGGDERGVVVDEEGGVKELIRGTFDVVSMSLVLSYLPNATQRRQMIRRARALLKDPHPYSSAADAKTQIHPSPPPDTHQSGLLLIVEKQSIFNMPSVGGSRYHNASFIHGWKSVIAEEGFRLVKYRRLRRSDGRHSHVFAFRTVSRNEEGESKSYQDSSEKDSMNITTSGSARGSSTGGRLNAEMHIRQDFVSDSDYNLSKECQFHNFQRWKRTWGWTTELIEAESGG